MNYGSAPDDEKILSYSGGPSTTSKASSTTLFSNGSKHTNIATPSPPASQHIRSDNPFSIINSPSTTTGRILDYFRHTWNARRPWLEFYSTSALSIPPFPLLSDRFSTNLHLYRANYQVIAAFWLVIAFLGAIQSFVITAMLLFIIERWCLYQSMRNGNVLSNRDLGIAVFSILIVIWLTGFAKHLVVSLAFSSISIAIHAALHDPTRFETEIANV